MTNYEKVEGLLYQYRSLKIEIKNLNLEIKSIENSFEDIRRIGGERISINY